MIKLYRRRGVAQLARVLAWGARGRQFKSGHSDHAKSLRDCISKVFPFSGRIIWFITTSVN